MKRILSILLFFLPLVAFSQKATVESVVLDPLNISASKYPMTDLNGNTAPLVIVRVLADNVEFLGSVLDGGVVRRTGEYWVYMGAGAKMLHIHSDKFLPVEIRFPDYDIPRLESSATYIVTLILPQPVLAQPTEPHPQQSIASASVPAQAVDFSTAPVHLALCAIGPDGRAVYITADQWKTLPESARSVYTAKGVCVSHKGEIFLVELHDKEDGKRMKWSEALKYSLPTKEQAKILVKHRADLNGALRSFGGGVMDGWYWTETENSSSHAWDISITDSKIYTNLKSRAGGVRAVVPVP